MHRRCRDHELGKFKECLRDLEEVLQQTQQRARADASQLAQRDEQISRLHEQALTLEKE